jgi:Putative zinc-finger
MDHKQSVELQLAVKYVLGELPAVQRDEYEDHYMDCPECAKDVYAAAALADTAREVFRQEGRSEAPAAVRDRVRGGWLAAWLRPVVAVPVFAALLLVIAYQNVVTIPRVKQEAVPSAGAMFTSVFSLQMANVRGGDQVKVQVHPSESFGLKFDFIPAKAFGNYLWQLQGESGHALMQATLPGSSANHEVELAVRGGLVKPGKYNIVFMGLPDSNSQGAREEVLRLGFYIEFFD